MNNQQVDEFAHNRAVESLESARQTASQAVSRVSLVEAGKPNVAPTAKDLEDDGHQLAHEAILRYFREIMPRVYQVFPEFIDGDGFERAISTPKVPKFPTRNNADVPQIPDQTRPEPIMSYEDIERWTFRTVEYRAGDHMQKCETRIFLPAQAIHDLYVHFIKTQEKLGLLGRAQPNATSDAGGVTR